MAKKTNKTAKDVGRRERLLAALISCDTLSEACRASGVPGRTARRWLSEPEFSSRVERARRKIASGAISQVHQMVTTALKTLEEVCKDKKQLGRDRVNAAGKILDAAFKAVEVEEIRERLSRLEEGLP